MINYLVIIVILFVSTSIDIEYLSGLSTGLPALVN